MGAIRSADDLRAALRRKQWREGKSLLKHVIDDERKTAQLRDLKRKWQIKRQQALQRYSEDQPRDENGRWTDGGSSDSGGSAPVSGYTPGTKTPATPTHEAAQAVNKEWASKSPVKTIDDAKHHAEIGQKALGAVGKQIADKLGLTWIDPGPKTKTAEGVQRVQDKAAERKVGLNEITDLARGTFLVDHPDQTDKINAELAKHFEVATEPWRVTKENYGDRASNVRLPNGVVAEVQMMHPEMKKAKFDRGGHDLYVVSRATSPTGKTPDPTKHAEAVQKQKELYGGVLANLSDDWKKLLKTPT